MKQLTLFYFDGCPYCKNALKWQEELFESHPEYKEVPLRMIDEREEPEIAEKYDYYFVPTYFLDDTKLCEGFKEKNSVEDAFKRAYEG